ncbi:histone H3-lysine(4) N-trimethyltransferase ATX1 isoform X4 [Ricinus communis]|uniref:histone H3-lysine(4) N-trimethyltransferase ATX1 isoform X4 n=1 Tax=Ricinus communis TaxID=3988 RepID=UPI00201B1E2A|nr:histone H3-lysine(4) N-trimethyltransferase ATX1 isoform X4 [Ricinus communis]
MDHYQLKGKAMEGKICTSSQTHDNHDDDVKEVAAENLDKEPSIGDVIWIKLPRSLWWPAVVVGNNFDKGNRSGDRLTGNVRVRLYGSYKYMSVDPFKWHFEFQIILKQNNGCYQEIFRKSLEQDQSGSKSGQVKRKVSKSKG